MYVDRVRESIKKLTIDEYDEYLERLRFVLRRIYMKKVKPSDLKKRVNGFINGKDPDIDYFEAYMLTFDELAINGGFDVLQNKNINMPKTWRQLLLKVTEDRPLSPDLIKYLDEDKNILIEIKALFYNSIEHCKGNSKEQFFSNLHTFNSFLKIK